mmetsp:Transcript_8757/g.36987  ORF Transcript_8757/g.36987 Transcript_8757/m.36987 type:complete len:236 (+) Transcript_8757:1290-1997(+)
MIHKVSSESMIVAPSAPNAFLPLFACGRNSSSPNAYFSYASYASIIASRTASRRSTSALMPRCQPPSGTAPSRASSPPAPVRTTFVFSSIAGLGKSPAPEVSVTGGAGGSSGRFHFMESIRASAAARSSSGVPSSSSSAAAAKFFAGEAISSAVSSSFGLSSACGSAWTTRARSWSEEGVARRSASVAPRGVAARRSPSTSCCLYSTNRNAHAAHPRIGRSTYRRALRRDVFDAP